MPLRWVAVDVFGMGDVGGTRATGIIWLCLGLLVLWAAARVVGQSPVAIGAAVLLLGSAPLVVYQVSSISNGAASIFAGSSILLLAALAWRHSGRWAVPVLAAGAFVVVSIAEPNILPVVIASALFGIAGVHGPEASFYSGSVRDFLRAWWPRGGALLLGGLGSAIAWVAISRSLSIIDPKLLPPFAVLRTGPHGLEQIAREAVLLLGPVTDSYNTYRPTLSTAAQNLGPVIDELLRTLLLAGGLACLFVHRRRWYHWMGLASLVLLYFGGLLLGIGISLTYDTDPGLSGRYGMSLAPFLVIALVAAIRGRWVPGALWAVAIATFATTLGFTLVG